MRKAAQGCLHRRNVSIFATVRAENFHPQGSASAAPSGVQEFAPSSTSGINPAMPAINTPLSRGAHKLTAAIMLSLVLALPTASHAHRNDGLSELSALSALPVASVVISTGAASAAVATLPVALSVGGATLIVKSVESTARGTLCVLERASDGALVTLEFSGRAMERAAVNVGRSVQVGVLASGAVLSVLGEAIAFVPNELGRALLHNERITY